MRIKKLFINIYFLKGKTYTFQKKFFDREKKTLKFELSLYNSTQLLKIKLHAMRNFNLLSQNSKTS